MKKLKSSIRTAALASVLLGAALPMSAKPAIRQAQTVTQPNGTEITLRLVGDEHAHLLLTEDGRPVLQDSDGTYVYARLTDDGRTLSTSIPVANMSTANLPAPLDPDMVSGFLSTRANALRKTAPAGADAYDAPERARGYGLTNTGYPVTGSPKALVILVEYSDVAFGSKNKTNNSYSSYTDAADGAHTYWDDLLNKPGFDGFGGTGSCSDWFQLNSTDAEGNIQFNPDFDLYGPVTLPNNMAYYGGNNSYGQDSRPYEMVVDACQLLDDQIDFSLYDTNGDGKVDNVFVFYAGYGEADYGGADTVWPHSFNLSSVFKSFKLDGVTIDHYACSNETVKSTRCPDGIGTFVHEFSHVMGLPDLYSTTYNEAYTPGEYSVLDYGPYNNNGHTPPNYSTFERYALGWISPVGFVETGEYQLENLVDSNRCYMVKTDKTKEYFLVENRQQTGNDRFLPGHGMLVWHVDYKSSVFDSNTVNNNPSHQYVDLVEASGLGGIRPVKSAHPFPGTSNVTECHFTSWSGRDCKRTITEIAEENGIIKMHVDNTAAVENIEEEGTGTVTRWSNLQGMPVSAPTAGQVLIRIQGNKSEKVIY